MDLLLNVVLLLVGFVLLIKGADYFVEGASYVAKALKVPTIIVGLTIVSIGTSAPELAVSISAAAKGENAMAISNVIGSNLFNLLVVLGACALIKPIHVAKDVVKRDFPFSIILVLILLLSVADRYNPLCKAEYTGDYVGTLGRKAGILFLILLVAFIIVLVVSAMKSRKNSEDEPFEKMNKLLCAVFIFGGAAAIVYGGDVVVDNAKAIAIKFGMSETLVGLTIVAIGTSLPELVTSLVASKKGANDMAVGNVVGSNIFNILLVLGASITISPMLVLTTSAIDLLILAIVSIISYIVVVTKNEIGRLEGFIMVMMYAVYMVYACIR